MQTVEQFLHEIQAKARERFPEIGMMLYAVVDDDVTELREIICVTNLDDAEMQEVMGQVQTQDFEIVPTAKGRMLS